MSIRKKYGGRIKGTPNKISTEMRIVLKEFLHRRWPDIEKAFDELPAKDRILAYTRFLPYIAPQYQSVSMALHTMTTSDLETIVAFLKKDVQGNTIDIETDE